MSAIRQGLLWLIGEEQESTSADAAIDRYREKYGRQSGDIRLHPDTRKVIFSGAVKYAGCRLIDDEAVPRQHLWIVAI